MEQHQASDSDTCRGAVSHTEINSEDTTNTSKLKDRLVDFFQGMAKGNSQIVLRVQNMLIEQHREIGLLGSRISSLNTQLDTQKAYFQKREEILKCMYEKELEQIEQGYSRDFHTLLDDQRRIISEKVQAAMVSFEQHCHHNPSNNLSNTTNEAGTQADNPCKCILWRDESVDAAGVIANSKHSFINAGSCTSPRKTGTRCTQCEWTHELSPPRTDDYRTCLEASPLKAIGTILSSRIEQGLNDDKDFYEAEHLHGRTQKLYSKLNMIMAEFQGCSTELDNLLSQHPHCNADTNCYDQGDFKPIIQQKPMSINDGEQGNPENDEGSCLGNKLPVQDVAKNVRRTTRARQKTAVNNRNMNANGTGRLKPTVKVSVAGANPSISRDMHSNISARSIAKPPINLNSKSCASSKSQNRVDAPSCSSIKHPTPQDTEAGNIAKEINWVYINKTNNSKRSGADLTGSRVAEITYDWSPYLQNGPTQPEPDHLARKQRKAHVESMPHCTQPGAAPDSRLSNAFNLSTMNSDVPTISSDTYLWTIRPNVPTTSVA